MKLSPIRTQIAIRQLPAGVAGEVPIFVTPSDLIYGRPKGDRRVLVGSLDPRDESEQIQDPDLFDRDMSSEFRGRMVDRINHRFGTRGASDTEGFAALYTVNLDD